MSTPIALIQLVSEQTMPNLLPVLRLKPARLIHFVTPKTVSRSALIAEAARQSQVSVELETVRLSAMPSMREAHDAVLAAIQRAAQEGTHPVVNFTGGTKLMSIGAYVAASRDKTPSLYVDTQDSLFVDGQTGPLAELFGGDLSFTPILRRLSVHAVAKANGCHRVTGGHDWRHFLELAEHFFGHRGDEERTHAALHGSGGMFPFGKEPKRPADWFATLDHEIALPETVCRLATACGLVSPGASSNSIRLPEQARRGLESLVYSRAYYSPEQYFSAVAPLQRTIGFLTGGWLEVIVASRMERCGRFRDSRWSIQVGEKGGADLEEDIVALDGVQIACVSCKRGGAKGRLLPLLEEINARARSLGGTFTQRFLAIAQKPSGKVFQNLDQRARQLGVRLLFPEDLCQPDPFA
jgi:hypothetical protein